MMRRRRIILLSVLLAGVICALLFLPSTGSERKAVEKTRSELRQRGFKIDLSEFNLSTSSELRARASALTNAIFGNREYRRPAPLSPALTSLRAVGSNSALVVWKEENLDDQQDYVGLGRDSGESTWAMIRQKCDEDRALLDSACEAALSGPIRFDLETKAGFAMRLPHLAALRNLQLQLEMRALLELRDKHQDAAWTNLIALTRLVTAYEPEPVEVAHLVRYASVTTAYNATWQLLQHGGWSEEQLKILQREWESVNFFEGWPETAAFGRASAANACQREREQPLMSTLSLREIFRSPRYAWPAIVNYRRQAQYRRHGSYVDENDLMLYYRDRELQLRDAIKAPSWSEMRQLPGVTNALPFRSKYPSGLQALLNSRQMGIAFRGGEQGPLGRAAEAEAYRRIILTALAVECFHVSHGVYPKSTQDLLPEFVQAVPIDFMDGMPLRYLLYDDGHYMIYSIGLDCVDNGGIIPNRQRRGWMMDGTADPTGYPGSSLLRQPADLVWPRPATTAEVEAQKAAQKNAEEVQRKAIEVRRAEMEVQEEAGRQAAVHELLDFKQPRPAEPNFDGRPISEVLQRDRGGSKLTMDELLTLKQVITGQEPNVATFEIPVSYDVVTNIGELRLVVDGGREGLIITPGQMQEVLRATNGNCIFTWETIYDPPGRHALQIELQYLEKTGSSHMLEFRGPVSPFTSTNICQFNPEYSQYDAHGVTLYAKLPETNGTYKIELMSPLGEHVKTISGSTSNGVINVHWDLIDERGKRYTNASLDSFFYVTLPDSGRVQSMKGP
jgi:hypothetical protein